MAREIQGRTLSILLAAYFVLVLNLAFWRETRERMRLDGPGDALFIASLPIAMFLILFAAFQLLLWPRVEKAVVALLLPLSAVANHFMFELGVFIDRGMMRNVFMTNSAEAGDMVTMRAVAWVLLTGVLPVLALLPLRVAYLPLYREIRARASRIACAAIVLAVMAAFLHPYYLTRGREHRVIAKLINPVNYLVSGGQFIAWWTRHGGETRVIDPDPVRDDRDPRPQVLVLVIGETARSVSFSLNGYPRETNPRLAQRNVISFPKVTASATYTDFALPCLFSPLSRKEFDIEAFHNSEGLLDVLHRAGMDVVWFDNYGGSKGAADRLAFEDLRETGPEEFRNGDFNYDAVLLHALKGKLAAITRDTVIVLHMMGSHGPRYFRRYPPEFRVFTPTWDAADIQQSPRENLVNTYDNTILYTDYVLSEAIDTLAGRKDLDAGLIYISDHGESLGEHARFLHGAPYEIAPPEQLLVPFIVWMSDGMRRDANIDYDALRASAGEMELSHDNFFHSVIGLLGVDTELYEPDLDVFGAAPRGTAASFAAAVPRPKKTLTPSRSSAAQSSRGGR